MVDNRPPNRGIVHPNQAAKASASLGYQQGEKNMSKITREEFFYDGIF